MHSALANKNLNVDNRYSVPKFLLNDDIDFNNTKENKIIINTEFFNMLHSFKINDEIMINLGGKKLKFVVGGLSDKIKSNESESFGFIMLNSEYLKSKSSIKSVVYKLEDDNIKLREVLDKIPSAYIYNIRNMNSYTQQFINRYRGVYIYSTLITIVSGLFFLVNGSYVSVTKKYKEMSIFYALGASVKNLQPIYLMEGLIIGSINIFVAIFISNYLSRFFIEVIAQKTYIFNLKTNLIFILLSILINLLVYWKAINKLKKSDINLFLRE